MEHAACKPPEGLTPPLLKALLLRDLGALAEISSSAPVAKSAIVDFFCRLPMSAICDMRCAIFACFVGRMMDTAADEEGQRGVIINTASVAAYEGQVRDTFQRRFFFVVVVFVPARPFSLGLYVPSAAEEHKNHIAQLKKGLYYFRLFRVFSRRSCIITSSCCPANRSLGRSDKQRTQLPRARLSG